MALLINSMPVKLANGTNAALPARRRWRAGLRPRLLLLVTLALLPALSLILWSAYQDRAARLHEADRQAERVAARGAAAFGQLVEFSRQSLVRLADYPEVRTPSDPLACGRRLAEVRKLNPAYGLLGVVGPDGLTVCADDPSAVGVYLGDRDYFRRAVATREFVTSGFLVGRTTGMSIMVLAQPVLDEHGAVRSVLFMSMDLDWIGEQLEQMMVPPSSNIALIDRNGTVMAVYPETSDVLGRQIPELTHFFAERRSGRQGGLRLVGHDGIERIYVTVPLPRVPPGSGFVRAGIPTAALIAQADQQLQRNLLVLATVALLALLAAWYFAGLLVVKPTRQLLRAVEALGSGNMAARSQMNQGGELGELARHFDVMAARLQRLTRALRTLSAGNRSLLRAEEEGVLLAQACRIAVYDGGYRLAWVGYARSELRQIEPMAVAGDDGVLNAWVEAHAGDDDGPTRHAIRHGTTQLAHGLPHYPEQDADAGPRYTACALPLKVHGETIGALTLYADDPQAFDEAEHELLEEMAADLSFGIQTLRDRREHARAEEQIRQMAYVDTLTGLANRSQLELRCSGALTVAQARGGQLAIVVVNLVGFTRVQNAIGFDEGDRLIVDVAQRLREAAHASWVVARLVSDRFAVLVPDADAAAALRAARRLAAEFERPFSIANIYVELGANIGIAVYPEHGSEPALLIRRADVACLYAQSGGAGIELYRGESEKERPERLQLMAELRHAIEDHQLSIHYQGKVDAISGAVTGAEALLRWHHPVRGDIPPASFIGDAEQTGLIKPLSYWVLNEVLRQLSVWRQEGGAVPVAVNLSVRNFRDPALLDTLRRLLQRWQVPPELLEIEITEGVLVEDARAAEHILAAMRALGLRILIDDFGTGYSSLRYLASLPVDVIKIDRSFVSEMERRPDMHALVAAVIDLGHKLGLKIVAEGVEDERQVAILRRIECDEIQGFFYSMPSEAAAFRAWLRRQRGGAAALAPA